MGRWPLGVVDFFVNCTFLQLPHHRGANVVVLMVICTHDEHDDLEPLHPHLRPPRLRRCAGPVPHDGHRGAAPLGRHPLHAAPPSSLGPPPPRPRAGGRPVGDRRPPPTPASRRLTPPLSRPAPVCLTGGRAPSYLLSPEKGEARRVAAGLRGGCWYVVQAMAAARAARTAAS